MLGKMEVIYTKKEMGWFFTLESPTKSLNPGKDYRYILKTFLKLVF